MKLLFATLAISFVFLLVSAFSLPISANSSSLNSSSSDVPEVNGDFADPKDKTVRVRVFVHEAKRSHQTQTLDVCADNDSTRDVDDERWRLPSNVTFNLNLVSVPASVGSGTFADSVAPLSFSTWQNAVLNKVNFSRGADTSVNSSSLDGQNIVAWGNTSSSTLGVTYIRYYRFSGQVVDVDTILNQNLAWSWTPYSANVCANSSFYDAQNILTHEIGHWMGLDDEYTSRYRDHTMFGYGSKGETKKDTLTSGDTLSVQQIYP